MLLPVCMSVYYLHVWCPWKPEKKRQEEGTGHALTGDTRTAVCAWESIPSPLEE